MLHKDLGELENIISQLWITTKTIESGKKIITPADIFEVNTKIDDIIRRANELKLSIGLEKINQELPPAMPKHQDKVA